MSAQAASASYPVFTPHKADASADAFRHRYGPQMAYLTERLSIPPADEIYSVNEARLAQRPRLDFADHSVADLRRRAADPRFAVITDRVHAFATRVAGATPPATIVPDAHDPNRPFADGLAWMAMSFLIDPEATRRALTLAGLRRWLAAFRAWGPMTTNLSLAQSTLAQARVY
ncbi:MAG: hypothetical protein H7067_04330, partial [Burkholderiales bacterium]|nr:hypothetical protein [Opitutaceae bacterium]